jgi:hypothetical protein
MLTKLENDRLPVGHDLAPVSALACCMWDNGTCQARGHHEAALSDMSVRMLK